MKKTILSILAVALAFVACNKIETPADKSGSKITFDFTVENIIAETRAAKAGWENGDKINIWFDDAKSGTPDLVLTYNGSAWIAGELRKGAELKETGKIRYFYESGNDLGKLTFEDWLSSSYKLFNYTFPKETWSGNTVAAATMIASGCDDYTYSSGKVESTLSWNPGNGTNLSNLFQVTITDLSEGDYALNISAGNLSVIGGIKLYVASDTYPYCNIEGRNSYWYAKSLNASDGKVFYFNSNAAEDVSGSISFTLMNKAGKKWTYNAGTKTIKKGGTYQAITIPFKKFSE